MSKIEQLTTQINEIEEQAGQLDSTEYEELYNLLIVAYYHAKDIIELMKANIPVIEDNALEDRLRDSQDAVLKAESLAAGLQLELDSAQEKNKKHTLEIAKLQDDIKRQQDAITAVNSLAVEAIRELKVI